VFRVKIGMNTPSPSAILNTCIQREKIKKVMDEFKQPRISSWTYRIPVPLESGMISSFIATLEVDGMGGYNLNPSLTT
jgi:hypothetical protein